MTMRQDSERYDIILWHIDTLGLCNAGVLYSVPYSTAQYRSGSYRTHSVVSVLAWVHPFKSTDSHSTTCRIIQNKGFMFVVSPFILMESQSLYFSWLVSSQIEILISQHCDQTLVNWSQKCFPQMPAHRCLNRVSLISWKIFVSTSDLSKSVR